MGSDTLVRKLHVQNAINTAMTFDRCRALPSPAERAQCQLDKALVNVGALFAKVSSSSSSTSTSPCFHCQPTNRDVMST